MTRQNVNLPRARLHRCSLAFVVFCFVCAQALGFMHGIVHGVHAGDPAAHSAAQAAEGGVPSLFASHADAEDCRLFDALGQQLHTPPLLDLALGHLPSLSFERLLEGAFIARWAALFDARGPPLSR